MKNRPKNKEKNSLRANDRKKMSAEDIIKSFYRDYRDEFVHFGLKYNMTKESLVDIFQDIVVIFFEQKESGKIENLQCTDKTYLFSLGKHKIIDFLRKNKKVVPLNHDLVLDNLVNPKVIEGTSLTDRQKSLTLGIKKLGKKCQDVITLFYSRQLSIAEIADRMGYKTENVVKAHKSRCMKTLKQIVSTVRT